MLLRCAPSPQRHHFPDQIHWSPYFVNVGGHGRCSDGLWNNECVCAIFLRQVVQEIKVLLATAVSVKESTDLPLVLFQLLMILHEGAGDPLSELVKKEHCLDHFRQLLRGRTASNTSLAFV